MNAFNHDVDQVKPHKRELPRDMIASGAPQVHGRILEAGRDGCIACVVWQKTLGTVAMNSNSDTRVLSNLPGRQHWY